jgi:hypothetical protein
MRVAPRSHIFISLSIPEKPKDVPRPATVAFGVGFGLDHGPLVFVGVEESSRKLPMQHRGPVFTTSSHASATPFGKVSSGGIQP